MLLTLVLHQPQMLGTFVRHTPVWVWGLLAALLALGASQLRERTASLARVSALPLGMTAFVKARCNQCHIVAGHGVNLGPDLVESVKTLGRRRGLA